MIEKFEHTDKLINARKLNFSLTSVNTDADTLQKYNEAKTKYPMPAKVNCLQLKSLITNLDNELQGFLANRAKASTDAYRKQQDRYIDAYTQYQNEVKSLYNNSQCDKQIEDAATQQFFDTQAQQLSTVQSMAKSTGNTTKYVVIGGLAVVVIISAVLIFK